MKIKIPAMGSLLKDMDIVNSEFGPNSINEEKVSKFLPFSRGSVRISSDRYYTASRYEARKKKVYGTKLP
jgi:hypothetical protein